MAAVLTIEALGTRAYAERTRNNAAQADLTVAFALDFASPGERLTRVCAGYRYVALRLDAPTLDCARALYKAMRHREVQVLNVAGNGLHTLHRYGISQAQCDAQVLAVLELATRYWPIRQVVCGGQTGADIAGAAAALVLGIDVRITMPYGFLQRAADGVDREHTESQIRDQVNALAADLELMRAQGMPSGTPSEVVQESVEFIETQHFNGS
jgi:hypothetical protein